MDSSAEQGTEQIEYPWLVFKLASSYYAINSHRINGIMMYPSDFVPIPNTPDYVRGVYMPRGIVVRLMELRGILGLTGRMEEVEAFTDMLEQRKQDHIVWVKELERCAKENEPFGLATDPHKCAFGQWYYNFHTNQQSIAFHLKQIEEPHRLLHEAAIRVQQCSQDCQHCQRVECLKEAFHRLHTEFVPQIVKLLDESKELFRTGTREMVVTLEDGDQQLGLIVDEVISVEQITMSFDNQNIEGFEKSPYVQGICQSSTLSQNVLMLDDQAILKALAKVTLEV